MRRFSIRTLMASVLVFAVGLTALRNANDLWAGLVLLVVSAIDGTAVLGAISLRGSDRNWCLGFAVFCSGYLVLTFLPPVATELVPKLGTTQLLKYVHSHVTGSPIPQTPDLRSLIAQRDGWVNELTQGAKVGQPEAYLKVVKDRIARLELEILAVQGYYAVGSPITPTPASLPPSSTKINRWQHFLPGAANYDQFLRIGHSLFALVAGLIGAVINTWFYGRRERAEPPPDASSSRWSA